MIKTRFAPSPTGYLHIGSLRTAFYNYLFTKKNNGKLLLRIEDTDQERYVEGSIENLIKTLKQVGIEYDEGPIKQSDRLDIYKKYAEKLVEQGSAYYCFCSKERLLELRKEQETAKITTKYDKACLKLNSDEVKEKIKAGDSYVIRLNVPDGETAFEDIIRGKIRINNSEIDDQVLLKSDGFPTYHLAVVVDDHEMDITHVIRGEEWLTSTPKHVILYKMFGWNLPEFAHLPLILNPDKSKLSKRQGDVAVEEYLTKGYLPDALTNFVALLGFNPKSDQELYSTDELIKDFNLKKVNKGGAVFNREKLDWMNSQYIRSKSDEELLKLLEEYTGEKYDLFIKKIISVEKERLVLLSDFEKIVKSYQQLPKYDPDVLVWKKSDKKDAKEQLSNLIEYVSGLNDEKFDKIDLLEKEIKNYISENNLSNGNVLWPMRAALSGKKDSAGPFELAWVLGKEESLNRLKKAHDSL